MSCFGQIVLPMATLARHGISDVMVAAADFLADILG